MQLYFRIAGVEDPEHVAEARKSGTELHRRSHRHRARGVGEEIFDEVMAHRIWPGTRALAQLHLDEGQRVGW